MSFARFGECGVAEADGILLHVLGKGEITDADYRRQVDELVSYKRAGRLKGGTLVLAQSSIPSLSQSQYMRDQLMPYRNDPMSCAVLSDSVLMRATINALGALLRVSHFRVQLHSLPAADVYAALRWLSRFVEFDRAVVRAVLLDMAKAFGHDDVVRALRTQAA